MLQRYCSWESGETEEASESQVCPSLSCSDWLIKCGDWGVAADLQARLLQADAAHYELWLIFYKNSIQTHCQPSVSAPQLTAPRSINEC